MVLQRFKALREELQYTQQAFAGLLGVPTSTADIERGKTKIPGYVVVQLMKEFNINPLWLFGESEEKYIGLPKNDISPKVITVNSQQNENILLVNQKAAAGYPQNIHNVEWYEQLPSFDFPLPQFRNATYRGFQVEGDSMIPNIRPDEWVIGRAVSGVHDISDNRVYVVVLNDSVLVKKLKKVHSNLFKLISFNEEYPPLEVSLKDIQELWLVNSKISFGVEDDSNSFLFRQLQASMQDLKSQISKFSKTGS